MIKFLKTFAVCLTTAWFCASQGGTGPTITNTSGDWIHGSTVQIAGSGFGSKSPAAPLIWDDCEGRTTDSDAAIAAVWDEVMPWLSGAAVESHRTRYRTSGFRGVAGPHVYSQQFAAGGHYQYPDNDPPYIGSGSSSYRNVGLTVDSGTADKAIWYARFYHRVDPLWTSPCPSWNNHKTTVVQTAGAAYTGTQAYNGYRHHPCESGGVSMRGTNGSQGCSLKYDTSPYEPLVNNPRLQWISIETLHQSDAQVGRREIRVDNVETFAYGNNCINWFNDTRSFSIGGYYRFASDLNDVSTYRGCNDCFRYFDDIYIDNTWARVMLGDASTYATCTILEPQIPSAWSDGSITVTVNRGAISGDIAWLYIFNADDIHSAGFPVDLTGDDPPPDAPQNFRVVQ